MQHTSFVTVRPSLGVLRRVAGSQETGRKVNWSVALRCCISYWCCIANIAKDVVERLGHVIRWYRKQNQSGGLGTPAQGFWVQNAGPWKLFSPTSIMLSACLRWQYRDGLGGVFRSIRPVWPRWPSDMILVIFRCSPYTPFPPPTARDSCVIRSSDVSLRVEVLCLIIGGLPVKLLSICGHLSLFCLKFRAKLW